MGLYEVHLYMALLGFEMGTMLVNFHMCGIMLVLRAIFNIWHFGMLCLSAISMMSVKIMLAVCMLVGIVV